MAADDRTDGGTLSGDDEPTGAAESVEATEATEPIEAAEPAEAAEATESTEPTGAPGSTETTERPAAGAPKPRSRTAVPVRSAPLRRRAEKAAPRPARAATGGAATGSEAGSESAAELGEPTLSYRERRRARAGGTPTGRPVRTRPRVSPWTVFWTISAVLLIALAAVGTALGIGVYRADQREALRVEYADFARQVAINLTTFTPDTVEETLAAARKDLSGRAAERLGETVDQVAGAVRNSDFESRTTVISEAVTEATPTEGKVIMVFGTSMRDLAPQDPAVEPGQVVEVQTFRWWFQITRINGELKLTDFEWVY